MIRHLLFFTTDCQKSVDFSFDSFPAEGVPEIEDMCRG